MKFIKEQEDRALLSKLIGIKVPSFNEEVKSFNWKQLLLAGDKSFPKMYFSKDLHIVLEDHLLKIKKE